jgi:hypothetical protein
LTVVVAALPSGTQDTKVDVDVMRIDGTSISLFGRPLVFRTGVAAVASR